MEEAITIYHALRDIGKTFCIFTGFKVWSILAPENLRRVRSAVSSVGVSRGYTDYYQGRGQAIRLTANLINIHEPLI